MQPPQTGQAVDAAQATELWLRKFDAALQQADAEGATQLFLPDGHWRDLLAFTWNIQTMNGAPAIRAMLAANAARTHARNFALDPKRTPPQWVMRAGQHCIEALFAFETRQGRGCGVLRLLPDPRAPGRYAAWTLSTTLDELKGHEERINARRPTGPSDLRDFGAQNWLDERRKAMAYEGREPTVLVVGGGQAGLAIAARLGRLDIDTLIVDRNERIGDNWRKRYHSLALHNEVFVNHMPYMPFPPSWPVYIQKDRIANWFEAYVDALELNFWTSTTFLGGSYDERAQCWTVEVQRGDGSKRTLRPRHIVFAVGASPIPSTPKLPGLDSFGGTVMHSAHYQSGAPWRGRKALVLGTGTSGHDVAQDLHAAGAQVQLIQRSPTYVVSLKEAQRVYALYSQGIPFDDCDLLATSLPFPVLMQSYRIATMESKRNDQALLDALAQTAFRVEFLEDDPGFQYRYLQDGGGYYFNVGCSDLIIKGEIGVLQYADIERFAPEGALFRDGRTAQADLIVLATGYLTQHEVVRRLLGDGVAERIGSVWGFDAGGELNNMWKRTSQPGLWFTAGSFAQCRIFSRFLALQIKASELGWLPAERSAAAEEAQRR